MADSENNPTEVEGQIKMAFTDMIEEKENLKVLKKSIKDYKKNTDIDYVELKKQAKALNKQVKELQDEFEKDLHKDQEFTTLIDLKIKSEEKLANFHLDITKLVAKLPPKPIQLTIESELGKFLANINPEMRFYINGKEEKRA